ncbi:cysteine desulfurase family protein [Reichenbachiella versicolor]|uniref:cysteine desulfurase family protein n=1 Tax=Reichenbachiella versicolor TaxID=1821036 RepID=UPI000D6E68B9|nr:cysteine desulfurase family protein [Reichenbachiella versicolor]
MKKVYLDNSATTPVSKEVLEAMIPYFTETFGNPSSIHSHGRETRSVIEKSRKKIADLLGTSPAEIFFTSGGTEADNMAIISSISSLGVKHMVSSTLEHHAVLHTVEHQAKTGKINLDLIRHSDLGELDIEHLRQSTQKGSLVSIMHANNEIGNLNDINTISEICREKGAFFHTDTVQTMGKVKHNLQELDIDFLIGSAHKFHGPKGIGFIYVNANNKIDPFIHGGAQERNMRGGTENVAGIIGLAKALELAYENQDTDKKYIESIKRSMIEQLKEKIEGVSFNGLSEDLEKSIHTVLNVSIPESSDNDMLLFSLDIKGVSVSGGSACSSGTSIGSHVLEAINSDPRRGAIRFSFSKYTTMEEVTYAVDSLKELLS